MPERRPRWTIADDMLGRDDHSVGPPARRIICALLDQEGADRLVRGYRTAHLESSLCQFCAELSASDNGEFTVRREEYSS